MDSNELIILAAELCFALICVRALVAYLRGRDPVQRDVMIVFLAPTQLFVTDIFRRLGADIPLAISNINFAVLLLQPFLTLRLAARLRKVPRWMTVTAITTYAVLAGPMLLAPRPRPASLLVATATVFVVVEAAAAFCLIREARRRSGPSASRLAAAAAATALFAAALIVMFTVRAFGPVMTTIGRVLALLSALGYVAAFLPPAWLRRTWAARSREEATRYVFGGSAMASPEDVWLRYVDVVRAMVGTEAVAVLMHTRPGADAPLGVRSEPASPEAPAMPAQPGLDQPAHVGFAGAPPVGCGPGDLDDLLAAPQPVALRGRRAPAPDLRAHYAAQVTFARVSAHPLLVPPDGHGALLLFHERPTLFADDDLRLLADIGSQAGILAERGAIIGEQRRLADELEDTVSALRAASQAKSDFLANMSHELRTPLNAIIGFSDLMRDEPADGDQRSVPADWVDHIHSSGRHLLGLINDVLDLAKVEAGRLDLHPEPVRLDLAASELITALRPLLDGKGLTVEHSVPDDLLAHVDPVRFRQMLENLLSNAIKFTPAGGRITVTGHSQDANVLVTVADTGVGIAESDQQHVFEEFRQVGDVGQRKGGTGLGLALTRRLAQAHGGDIQLESTPDVGSRFSICLPVAASAASAPSVPAHTDPDDAAIDQHRRGRVLLIEDDIRSAELLRTYLLDAGYDVEVAGTGEAGIDAARRQPPDAVLLDVVLPGMHGWEVLRQMKADPALTAVPVFLVTVVDERRAGHALGADEYFVKPVDHGKLLGALARYMLLPDAPGAASVLVVEPDDEARERVERSLRASGANVTCCSNGRHGLELSRQQRFDLIVCDLQGPGVDGLALLAAFQDDPATRQTPVLALTPNGAPENGQPVVVGTVHGTATEGSAAWHSLMALTGGGPAAGPNGGRAE
jgi:signal transduction histidine kinase/DNA-binding response OmpR family regulator